MTFIATFILLMKAGALAKAAHFGGRLVNDSYEGAKKLLEDGYRISAFSLLEQKPNDQAALQELEHELAGKPIEADRQLIQLASQLAEALENLSEKELRACLQNRKD